MRYQTTVFGQLLKVISRPRFERLAKKHAVGRRKRELSEWAHFVAMVFAHTGGTRSLRDMERYLERHPGAKAHLDLGAVRRSTLADANRTRSAALFEEMAKILSGQASRGRGVRETVRLIDATRIMAGRRVAQWSCEGGIKLHLVYAPDSDRPVWFAVTPERINDITAARSLPIEPGATYVFDKGYYDFAFWARLQAQGCRFVTRLKRNSPVSIIAERPVPEGGEIRFDRVVRLSERLAAQRRNPLSSELRCIGVRISSGRDLVLLSNDLVSPAEAVADLYKQRWQVELFFKWLKQNLKIAHFLGTSRNAVTIQIMAALIAYLLMRIAQLRAKTHLRLQATARLIQPHILTRRCLSELLLPPKPPPKSLQPQLTLALSHA
jgi:hypothetical protein